MPQKISGGSAKGCAMKLGEGQFARAINGHEEIKPAFRRLHLGNIDVKETDRVGLELLLRGPIALDFRKPGYAVTLKASMQGRPAQMRNCRLKRIKAVVERKQSVPAQGDDDRLFFDRKHGSVMNSVYGFRPMRGLAVVTHGSVPRT